MYKQKKPTRIALLLPLVLLAALLAGCGGPPANDELLRVADAAPEAAPAAPEEATADAATGETGAAQMGGPTLSLPQDNRKVVLTANLELEAQDFDATCGKLQQSAEALGGYIAAADVRGDADAYTRFATFTVKIPAEKYGEYLTAASEAGNMLSRSEQSEDVTDSYTDVEARLKSLRTQEQRLLAMMEESARLDDLLQVQNQLTQVQYEIEAYTAQQRNLDGRIAYSTVYISVDEVDQITTPKPDDSFGTRLSAAFSGAWHNALVFLQGLAIGLVWLLPLLIVAAVVFVIVLTAVKKQRKKRAKNPPARQAQPAVPYYPYAPCPTAPAAPLPTQVQPAAEDVSTPENAPVTQEIIESPAKAEDEAADEKPEA